MSLPAIVSFPPAKLKKQIDPSEWNAFLSAWNSLVRAYIGLSQDDFERQALHPEAKIEAFLESFVSHALLSPGFFGQSELERSLKQSCLSLTDRLSNVRGHRLPRLQAIPFLQDLCLVYFESSQLQKAAEKLWQATRLSSNDKTSEWKGSWIKNLSAMSGTSSAATVQQLTRLVACAKSIPSCGSFLMEGSDFLDAIVSAWEQTESSTAKKLVAVTFYCLTALSKGEPKNISLLLDHLYSLKSNHEERMRLKKTSSLLEQMIGTTPLLPMITQEFSSSQSRGYTLIQDFQIIAGKSGLQRHHVAHHLSNKGKRKAPAPAQAHAEEEIHIHRMSLVTQVQDLFPGLDSSQILHLLDVYDDDSERVIAHLLDNPPSPSSNTVTSGTKIPHIPTRAEASSKLPPHAPYISQNPNRKNIYDNEDLATLSLDSSQLYTGHKPDIITLQTPSTSAKAAILSALAAFDSDSDERDDTYDVDDVGGTVDTTISGAGEDLNANEETLYLAWRSTPAIFAREATTRRSKPRAELREKTGLTDESIEGWAIMLSRDPRRQGRLATRYAAFAGQQTELQGSSWTADEDAIDSEGEVQRHHTDRGRGGRTRGRGPGRGRGKARQEPGGDAPASASTTAGQHQSTANERRRKDANKGSRANHNRRDQRAKKISRAGFPG